MHQRREQRRLVVGRIDVPQRVPQYVLLGVGDFKFSPMNQCISKSLEPVAASNEARYRLQ